MRDVDDAGATRAQRPDDGVQPIHVVTRQHRRRLVHDQNARVDRQCLGNLDDLLLADGQILDEPIRIDVRPESLQQRQRAAAALGVVEQAEATGWLGARERCSRPPRAPGSRLNSW